ncbi:MAG: biopolymer transporter Tol [Alphaproteobacteria bacterium]
MRVLTIAALLALPGAAFAQAMIPPPPPSGVDVPDWALPQSPTHKQVPPPANFHRPTMVFGDKIGAFEAQADVGGPLVPGSASFNAPTATYTISSAGYNIWYQRDEFRFLWKKMSGDFSLAATVNWTSMDDFHDRKVALILRDSLDDNSRQIMAAQHGNGMVHIAWRPETGAQMTDVEFRSQRQPRAGSGEKGPQVFHPTRIGLEKSGDQFQLWISWQGEPMHPEGAPVTFKTSGDYYAGIGMTSHLPATVLTARVRDLTFENAPGKVR